MEEKFHIQVLSHDDHNKGWASIAAFNDTTRSEALKKVNDKIVSGRWKNGKYMFKYYSLFDTEIRDL